MSIQEAMGALHRAIARGVLALNWLPPLAARLCLGLAFLLRGRDHLRHLDDLGVHLDQHGLPAASLIAPLGAGCELVFGSMLVIGLLMRLTVVPLLLLLLAGALWHRHSQAGAGPLLTSPAVLEMLLLLYLLVNGGGAIALDRVVLRSRSGRWKVDPPAL